MGKAKINTYIKPIIIKSPEPPESEWRKDKHKPPIAIWRMKNEWEKKHLQKKNYVEYDGKIFICNFQRVVDTPGVRPLRKFVVSKLSYEKQLEQIANYINYFIEMYDNENELLLAYMRIKFEIDKEKYFNMKEDTNEKEKERLIDGFIEFVHEELFSEDNHIRENIMRLTEDNYLDDVEKKSDGKKMTEKEYLESLEFTNEHVKVMLMISFAMKIISPIMFHYFFINEIEITKDSNYIYRFYKPLFTLFSTEINMFNKLFVYTKSRVSESNSINTPIFEKRNIFGMDLMVVINNFTKRVVISENMVKCSFPENWDEKNNKYKENIPGFLKTIIKFQLNYYLKEVYEKNLTEVSNIKNSEGLSGQDKMEMNIKKMDEGKALYAKMNAEYTPETIKTILDIPVYDWEIAYMQEHWHPDQIQIRLIYSYFSRYFGNYRDTGLVNRKNFLYLAVLLKKKLLLESGWEVGDTGVLSYTALPYVLTGNLEGKMNSRVIRNNKYMSKLEEEIHYRKLCDDEYSLLLEIHPEEIKQIISSFVNSRFTYVTPEEPELTGSDIGYSEDKIGSETSYFLFS